MCIIHTAVSSCSCTHEFPSRSFMVNLVNSIMASGVWVGSTNDTRTV